MKKSVLISAHLLYWVFTFISLPYVFHFTVYYFSWLAEPQHGPHERFDLYPYPGQLILTPIGACIFYASYFSLNFFLKRPVRFMMIAAFYVTVNLIISLPASFVSEQAAWMLGPVLYFNLSGFLFKACVEWFNDRKLNAELVRDRDASRLELLKTKLDPHFLFNNLNNIDVFILERPDLASDYLKKLSDILRFMLYESDKAKIPLQKEIEYIAKYIDLQRIRTSNSSFVKFEINGDPAGKEISPMILIHFIENSFKHAANKKVEDAIVVRLDISDRRLSFFCRNHISAAKTSGAKDNGLGIHLLRQKLDLLYKKDHKLVTKEENNWYIVELDIQLNED